MERIEEESRPCVTIRDPIRIDKNRLSCNVYIMQRERERERETHTHTHTHTNLKGAVKYRPYGTMNQEQVLKTKNPIKEAMPPERVNK
jgi:hypothetical protein